MAMECVILSNLPPRLPLLTSALSAWSCKTAAVALWALSAWGCKTAAVAYMGHGDLMYLLIVTSVEVLKGFPKPNYRDHP